MLNTLKIIFIFFSIFNCSVLKAQNTTASVEDKMNYTIEQKLKEHTIEVAQLGMLLCEDENGNKVICSGNEFEKILGFVTNVPFITINKYSLSQKENRDVYTGFASLAAGKIMKGNYVTAGKNGTLVRCEKSDYPYAVVLEDATAEGQRIRVKILGNRK